MRRRRTLHRQPKRRDLALQVQSLLSQLDSRGGCIGDAPSMARLTAQPLARVSTLYLRRHQRAAEAEADRPLLLLDAEGGTEIAETAA
jgi:hypothetical protein